MKSPILLSLLLLISLALPAQIHLNTGVDTSSLESKVAIEFMNQYITDFKADGAVNYADYYSKEDCERYVHPDKIAYSLIGNRPVYIMGHPVLLSIKEVANAIQLKLLFADSNAENQVSVNFISNHYISLAETHPQFIIPLAFNTLDWQEVQIRNIRFHFPKYHLFDTLKARKMIAQIEQLEKDWAVPTETIDYYFANTNQEIQQIKGFDFNFYMGKNDRPTGLADTKDNIIFCSGLGENYFHEIVHIYLNKKYPDSPLKEGIAVFYGGNMGQSLDWHLKRLNEYLQTNPTTNVTNAQKFYYLDEQTNPQYTIQGFLCALIFKEKGIRGLQQLMQYNSWEEIYQKEFKINQDQRNKFMIKKIQDYCQ